MPGIYDPQSKQSIGVLYRPEDWVGNTVYYNRFCDDYDIVVPTVFTGYYHKVINAGKSGSTEPTWATTPEGRTTDGSVIWEAVSYNLLDPAISVTASTWTYTAGVTLSITSFTGRATACLISASPSTIGSTFFLTNHVTYSNGEEDDVTLNFVVGSR